MGSHLLIKRVKQMCLLDIFITSNFPGVFSGLLTVDEAAIEIVM